MTVNGNSNHSSNGSVAKGGLAGSENALAPFSNNDSSGPIENGPDATYTIGEHLLWAPRKVRVGCIGAGASGIMFCYKKEKEFGDDIDLVVYERKSLLSRSAHNNPLGWPLWLRGHVN